VRGKPNASDINAMVASIMISQTYNITGIEHNIIASHGFTRHTRGE